MSKLEYLINELSKTYNYFENKVAIKLFDSMNMEEKALVLNNEDVKKTILGIRDQNVLRTIFRKVPAFFQEEMFNNSEIQDLLLTPKKHLDKKRFFESFNSTEVYFKDENIRELEIFLKTIKSKNILDSLPYNKFFQRIIVSCKNNQIRGEFFSNIDEVKLFKEIINDEEIYCKPSRKRNIINIFNKTSDYILLPPDYSELLADPSAYVRLKRHFRPQNHTIKVEKDMLNIFSTKMIEAFLKLENKDEEVVKKYLEHGLYERLEKECDFEKIFFHLQKHTDQSGYIIDNSFGDIDFILFNKIFEKGKTDENIKRKFKDFLYNQLIDSNELDEETKDIIKNTLYIRMESNSVTKDDYQSLFKYPDFFKTIFYLKFGKISTRMDYLNGISEEQLIKINVKHINQIIKHLNIENEDELSKYYSYAIKMYLVFGLERTLKILNLEYGKLNRTFFDNISKMDVKNVQLIKEGKKYIPKNEPDFINFMFASQNDNHFIDMLKDESSKLSKYFSHLYNNLAEIKEKCHCNITLKKLNIILDIFSPSKDLSEVTPNNFRLKENDILDEVCLGNITKKSNEEVYSDLLKIYDKMKRRVESSIPYVKGKASNGYTYEMMRLNDPIAFTLGYKGNCCIRIDDMAHNHLLHATLCRNGRILIIYNKNGEFASFVPLKRNGEVLIANSIECFQKEKDNDSIIAFKEAVKSIVNVSNKNTLDVTPIKLVCIGSEAYAKPKGVKFPELISTPTIYEKNDPIYADTDRYHKKLDIIYKNPNLTNLFKIKYGNPTCSYYDPRKPVRSYVFSCHDNDEALNIINAVRYENTDVEHLDNFKTLNRFDVKECSYNDDWFVMSTFNDEIYGECLSYDKRAEEEYQEAREYFEKKYHKQNCKKQILTIKRNKVMN